MQTIMKHFDPTPLYRNSIGVDRLMESLQSRANANHGNYPPYNIIAINDDKYAIEIAIAGFKEDEVNVTAHNGQLTVRGEQNTKIDQNYLHNGISYKKFKRDFQLADYVEVQNAELADGILRIELERIVPDSLKPKEIKINGFETPPDDE